MRKQIISIVFAIILLFALKNTCQAASANISCDNSATVGKEITITANVTGVMWNLELKVNGTTIAKNSELENVESNKTISFSGKYTPNTEGTLNVTLTGSVTEFSDGSTIRDFEAKSITVVKAPAIKDPEQEKPTTPENPGTTKPEAPTKSSEARLSNLGIKPNDFKGFKRNIYEYNVEVPNDVSKVNVYAEIIKDSNAKITSGTGKVELKEGINTVKVIVTAEDGKTTKTYTLNITRKAAEDTTDEKEEDVSSEARLKNLGIRPKEYDFSGFKKNTTSYEVEVPNDVEEIEVYAEAVSSKSKIEGIGKVALKEGENKIEIKVTAEDEKTTKTYTLNITRLEATVTETPEEEQPEDIKKEILGLTSLIIKDINLSPKFDSEIYEYTIGLTENLESLDIEAKVNESDATIEIIGNEDLKNGENIITILVSNSKTEENATYQIIVNKNVIEKEEIGLNWFDPSTWKTREKIIIGFSIVLIMVIIVAVVMKIKLAREEEEDFDLPGADELDKALTEHQELADDEKSDIEMAQEYFENYSKRKGKHF